MSKVLKLRNGKEIDLDILYPKEKRYPINCYSHYDDDKYFDDPTEEELKKYGIQKI